MSIKLSADAAAESVKTFKSHWDYCVGAGRANEALRITWLEHLERVHRECGFRYVRFHGLFHNDMFVYRKNEDGTATYNFQYIDEVFDRLLNIGVRPFVELDFCPEDMARPSALCSGGKATPLRRKISVTGYYGS